MSVLFEKRAAVLEHEAVTKRLKAEIELQCLKIQAMEIENVRRWAFAEDDPADTEWQKGYDSAKAMVRALLPANAKLTRLAACGQSGGAKRNES